MAVAYILDLPTECIDFVLAFPQSELDIDVYMELPIGVTADNGSPKVNSIKLNKYIYGFKQASINWFNLLSGTLQNKGIYFKPYQADPCLFLRSDCVVLTCVDDIFIIAKSKGVIKNIFESLDKG